MKTNTLILLLCIGALPVTGQKTAQSRRIALGLQMMSPSMVPQDFFIITEHYSLANGITALYDIKPVTLRAFAEFQKGSLQNTSVKSTLKSGIILRAGATVPVLKNNTMEWYLGTDIFFRYMNADIYSNRKGVFPSVPYTEYRKTLETGIAPTTGIRIKYPPYFSVFFETQVTITRARVRREYSDNPFLKPSSMVTNENDMRIPIMGILFHF